MPRYAVVALVLVVLVPWAVVVLMLLGLRPLQAAQGPGATAAVPAKADRHYCKPGPWGVLEYVNIVTRPPDEFISPNFFSEAPAPWVFKGYSKTALSELFISAGLTAAQCNVLERSVEFSAAANQCVVRPAGDLVLDLSPTARARIYAVLGKFPENSAQRDPFIFKADEINEWLESGGLAPATVALVKRLLYPHADFVLLSDCHTLVSQLPDAEERVRLFRILLRRRGVYAFLRVSKDSDVKALTSYWGKGGRAIAIGPLLESLPRSTDGIGVNVVLLLPLFARERLYTYPRPNPAPPGAPHDCHWCALNFFNEAPDDRLGQPEVVRTTIENDYFPVPGQPSMGDLVLFYAPDRSIVHSAVYIADDILFTKAGPSFTSPWLLMTQDEVLAAFPAYEKLDLAYFRLKKL